MRRLRWIAAVLALGMIAAACGRDDDDTAAPADETTAPADVTTAPADVTTSGATGDPATTAPVATTEPAPVDPCEGVTLEATEIGVSEDTITITVMADTGSPLAPGLFQGSIDAVVGWAEQINENGGLACREVKVEEADSQINPTETTNGFLAGCEGSLAMVGTNALFAIDVNDLQTCPDQNGDPTGIPDIAGLSVAPAQACSTVTFAAQLGTGSCPYPGNGPRDYSGSATGIIAFPWVVQEFGNGATSVIGLTAADLPSTKESSMASLLQGVEAAGLTLEAFFPISGSDDQSTYAPYIQRQADSGATVFYPNSNDQAMIKWHNEALAQGLDIDSILRYCSLSCYTESFREAGDVVAGTYIGMNFLPFEEADTNENLANYVAAVDKPVGFGANSWAAALLFQQTVEEIVAAEGPNALTRARLLEQLAKVESFDAGGMFGPVNIGERIGSPCFVVLQFDGSDFVRVHPEEPGTFDCEATIPATLEDFDAIAYHDANAG